MKQSSWYHCDHISTLPETHPARPAAWSPRSTFCQGSGLAWQKQLVHPVALTHHDYPRENGQRSVPAHAVQRPLQLWKSRLSLQVYVHVQYVEANGLGSEGCTMTLPGTEAWLPSSATTLELLDASH